VRKDIAQKTYGDTRLKPLVTDLANCASAPNAKADHPYFQGSAPCTMLIEEVEHIWDAISERDDWSVLESKIDAIETLKSAYGR